MSSDLRHDLISSAVSFLRDPKVASSSLTTRLNFLASKGLTDAEVQEALRQTSPSSTSSGPSVDYPSAAQFSPSPGAGPYGGGGGYDQGRRMMPPPMRPRRDWRDYFVMAVISGGVMYGLTALTKKYLLPHLLPPPAPVFTQTSTALDSQFSTLSTSLADLHSATAQLKAELEEERDKVRGLVAEVTRTLEEVRKREKEEKEWREEVSGEVEGLKEGLPKMLQSHTSLLQANLTSLQTELATLKPLLSNRSAVSSIGGGRPDSFSSNPRGFGAPGGVPSIPAWQQLPPAAAAAASPPPAEKEKETTSMTTGSNETTGSSSTKTVVNGGGISGSP